jgi:hypothetical protein
MGTVAGIAAILVIGAATVAVVCAIALSGNISKGQG